MLDILSPSNAFMLPQWGGIVIHNPTTLVADELLSNELDDIFSSFAGQFLALLGVPDLPSSLVWTASHPIPLISDWQLDALLRRRTLENASGCQETLLSIIKLVEQIVNMPVKEDVRDDVEGALSALIKVIISPIPAISFLADMCPPCVIRCTKLPPHPSRKPLHIPHSPLFLHLELSLILGCWLYFTSLQSINTQFIRLSSPALSYLFLLQL